MITRPLDLASRLRSEPRSLDWLFWVNVGLLVLFFSMFGSRFVLAPGLGVNFRLPVVAGAKANAKAPTHMITVVNSGQILTADGLHKMAELGPWLRDQARTTKEPLLLVRGSVDVPISVLAEIASAANRAGFQTLVAAGDVSDRPARPTGER